jgi:hypothetical protein
VQEVYLTVNPDYFMVDLKTYRKYRKVGMQLHQKMMKACLDEQVIRGSGKLLGIFQGDTLVVESEEETNAFMDFSFHEYLVGGKTVTQIYQETIGGENQDEKEILVNWLKSYTSLFKVVDVLKDEKQLVLVDLFSSEEVEIRLFDVSFSQSVLPGLLLFTRLVPFQDVHITSGIAFAFQEATEKILFKKYKAMSQKVKSEVESIQRFVTFFKLNRSHGMDVIYQ